jgi:predicted permease
MSEARRRRRARLLESGDMHADTRDEVETHLSLQIADLIAAGWGAEEARAEALRRFGDRRSIESQLYRMGRKREKAMRRTRLLGDLLQDLRLGVRQLRQRRAATAVAVLILALGIGASAAAFSLLDGALLRPLPLRDAHELVYVYDTQRGAGGYPASLPEFRDWEGSADFLDAVMAVATNLYTLTGAGEPEALRAGMLAGDALATFGLKPLAGRGFSREEMQSEARVVMLDEGLWQRRYGREHAVMGSTLRLNDELYTVIGVMPSAARLIRGAQQIDLWLPLQEQEWMTRGLHFLHVAGRLRDGATLASVRPRVTALGANLQTANASTHGLELADLRTELVGEARSLLLLLFGAAGFLLLIVCANLANLFLAQSLRRSREFAVRRALGAPGSRLVRQVLTEGFVLAVLGGVLGILLAHAAARAVSTLSAPIHALLPEHVLDTRVLAFTALTTVLVSLLFALWPALRQARTDPGQALVSAGDGRALEGRGAAQRRRLLVAAEVALSLILLAGAGLLTNSLLRLLAEEKGFDPNNVLTFAVTLQGGRYDEAGQARFYEQLLDRIRTLPAVVSAAATNHLPLDRGDTNGGYELAGVMYGVNDPRPNAKKRIVSPDYFATLGIPLLHGRTFTPADRMGAPDVVIVSEAVAQRHWPGGGALGKRIRYSWGPGDEQEIVGIVGDVKHDGLDEPAEPMIFRPVSQFPIPGLSFVIKTRGEPLRALGDVRQQLAAMDPALALFEVMPLTAIVRDSVMERRTFMQLLVGLALIALMIASVGVYAITAQAAAQRTREIGVRMAIGARRTDVVRMVLRQELRAVGIGLLVGLAGAFAATRLLRTALYGVSATDPLTFGSVAALLLLVTLLACWIPARRAARLDPVRALRQD